MADFSIVNTAAFTVLIRVADCSLLLSFGDAIRIHHSVCR